MDSNIVKTRKKYQDYLCNLVVNTFHLDPTLKNNKSTGPLTIPNKMFKGAMKL